jgi:hypothetical protein
VDEEDSKMADIHQEQADKNFAAFLSKLPELKGKLNKFALMRDGEIIAIYDTMGDALATADKFYQDGLFSIQKITAQPIDLGFRSRALHIR